MPPRVKTLKREKSTPTGLYMECPAWRVLHPTQPIAVPIMKGPQRFFCRCLLPDPLCGSVAFYGSRWVRANGRTAAQMAADGFVVL